MAHISGKIVINRPVEEVFDTVADERNEPRYNPGMLRAEKLSPGPVGLGSRFRAEMRTWPRPVVMTTECTGYKRPRLLASTTRVSTMDIQGTLTFDPVPEGTRMRWSWNLQPRGLLKLATPLVARQEEAIWTGLKRMLEEQELLSPLTADRLLPRAPRRSA